LERFINKKKQKKHIYRIGLKVKETWIFEIEADSKKEAKKLVQKDRQGHQVYSIGGWVDIADDLGEQKDD